MHSSVGWVAWGLSARGDLRRADVLRRLPDRPASGASVDAAGHGADGKHRNDDYDDDQRCTGDPPADRGPLLL